MKQKLCIFLVFAFAIPSAMAALNSQDLNKTTFLNETGHRLTALFVSPRDSQRWSSDILLKKKFEYGAILDYYVHYEGQKMAFDFLAFDEYQLVYLIESFEISDDHPGVVTISVRNIVRTPPKLQIVNVFATNATNRPISYLFFSPSDSNTWGFDILNNTTNLQPGGSVSFAVPVGTKDMAFEVLAVCKDQTVVQKRIVLSQARGDVFLDFTIPDLH